MEDKLRELTDKIYLEGVTRGNKEAEAIISEARAEAEKIRKEAEEKAGEIVEKARTEAEEVKNNTLSELRISFRHSLTSLKQDIENLISDRIVDQPVAQVMSDSSFVARLIETSVQRVFESENISEVNVNVPDTMADDIEQYIRNETLSTFNSGIALNPSGTLEKGFEIIPQGKEYKIRISESDISDYIKGFLRPRLVELLFEEDK